MGKIRLKGFSMTLPLLRRNKIDLYLRCAPKYAFFRVCGAVNIYYSLREEHTKFC